MCGWLDLVNEIIYFAIPGIGLILVAMGMSFKERIIGTLGAMLLMIYGVSCFITPIPGIVDFQNSLLASVTFGIGMYVLLAGNIVKIQEALS